MVKKLSGIQKEVLSLYRRVLREAIKKDRGETEDAGANETDFLSLLDRRSGSTTTSYASSEFRRQAAATQRSDFKKIEYMIRKGDKQIKLLRMPGVKVVRGATHT